MILWLFTTCPISLRDNWTVYQSKAQRPTRHNKAAYRLGDNDANSGCLLRMKNIYISIYISTVYVLQRSNYTSVYI